MANSKYGKIIAIATAVCAVLLGVLFIICCAHLYFTGGETPYSRERVGDYLIILAVPSFITIALAVGGLIFNYVSGASDSELTGRTQCELLESFASRYDFNSFDEETKSAVSTERTARKVIEIATFSISALLFVTALLYVTLVADFTVDNLNADVLAAFAVALPLAAIGVAIHIPRIYMAERSAEKELELLRASIKNHGAPAPAKKIEKTGAAYYTDIGKYVILSASVVLIILGITNGGMADVLQKAVKICTECIGLG